MAVAPWSGPATTDDARRWAIGYAILAPNSHNRQPWLVDLREANAMTRTTACASAARWTPPSSTRCELCRESARVELLTPRTVMESVRLTRVGPDEIARYRDGISLNAPMVRALDAVGLFDRKSPPGEGSAAFKTMMGRFEGHSNTAMGFVWLSTETAANAADKRTRSSEVTAGRAYVRQHLKATELGLQMHPMSQAPQEFAEMKPYYDRLHQLTVRQPASAATVQMFCRIGYCAEARQHTPRRGVDAILMT